MSPRYLALAWIAALAIVAAGAAAVGYLGLAATVARFAQADAVVVGSSLMLHAVPPSNNTQESLLGNGKRHERIGIKGISEQELLNWGALAVSARASLVLLEANPLIRDFAYETNLSCTPVGLVPSLRQVIGQEQANIASGLRLMLGRAGPFAEAPELDARTSIAEGAASFYPLRLRNPRCRSQLEQLVLAARSNGTRLALVLPPRSASGEALLTDATAKGLEKKARVLAADLHVPLLNPKGPWPDQEFIDHAHLNRAGRAHFIRELRQWWRRQP